MARSGVSRTRQRSSEPFRRLSSGYPPFIRECRVAHLIRLSLKDALDAGVSFALNVMPTMSPAGSRRSAWRTRSRRPPRSWAAFLELAPLTHLGAGATCLHLRTLAWSTEFIAALRLPRASRSSGARRDPPERSGTPRTPWRSSRGARPCDRRAGTGRCFRRRCPPPVSPARVGECYTEAGSESGQGSSEFIFPRRTPTRLPGSACGTQEATSAWSPILTNRLWIIVSAPFEILCMASRKRGSGRCRAVVAERHFQPDRAASLSRVMCP